MMTLDHGQVNPEIFDWLKARQDSLEIARTTRTPSGQTLDWVPIESQDSTRKIAAPPLTYYTTNGYTGDGNNLGGYNTLYSGWIQYSSTVFPGIRINGISTLGGTQTDVSMKFQLYREPNNGPLNWWVAVQGIWMGYYPASLFNGGLGNNVDWIGCGGEVFSSLSNPELTQDQMGSGFQAEAGWTLPPSCEICATNPI